MDVGAGWQAVPVAMSAKACSTAAMVAGRCARVSRTEAVSTSVMGTSRGFGGALGVGAGSGWSEANG